MQYTLAFALNQRWCDGRASYRLPTEPIRTAEYEVAEISDDATARQFITLHHYSHTYVTGQAIAVRWDGGVVHFSLNDIYEKAAREFGVDVKSITLAEY
jgi:hypothetical protein